MQRKKTVPPHRKSPVVWVVQESPGKNLLAARAYGELVVLWDRFDQLSLTSRPYIESVRQRMDYRPGDSLLAVGDPALIAICAALAALKNNGCLTLLKWDRREQCYIEIPMNLGSA